MNPTALPSHIVDAWTFVHGARWRFDALPPGRSPVVEPALALTVSLGAADASASLLVGCLIRHEDAVEVARHMFAPPDGEVSAEDVRDAGQEACNVLAGSVVADSQDPAGLRIGLPQALTLQQYQAIAGHARVRACYVGRPSEGDDTVRVVLTLFDLPATAPARELP